MSHSNITLGVDLSASYKNTATCRIHWEPRKATILDVKTNLDDEQLLTLMLDVQVEKIGIDVPLGWPSEFIDAITAHRDFKPWPQPDREPLRFRETDRYVKEKAKRTPLSVSSNLIGITAMRAAKLLSVLRGKGLSTDRSGQGKLVEVYPAAALTVWGLPAEGYKGNKGREKRLSLVKELKKSTSTWLDFSDAENEKKCIDDDNILDAVLSALIARAWILGRCHEVPKKLQSQTEQEGWIALPLPDTLNNNLLDRVAH
jgi:hypothetical protein